MSWTIHYEINSQFYLTKTLEKVNKYLVIALSYKYMYKKATICRTCLLFIFNTVHYYHRDISFLIMCRKFRYQIPLLIHFLNRKLKLNMVVSIQLSITIYSIYQSQHFKLKSLIHFKFINNSNTVTLTVVHMSCLPFGQTLANSHSTA